MNDFDQQVIDEFRANGGKVGGPFEGATLLILHSTGAQSGQERVNPVIYAEQPDGAVAIFASKGGAPESPGWYYNLKANPRASAEIGGTTVQLHARETAGQERDRIWTAHKANYPQFADYEAKTDRTIPVIVLEPVG